MKKKESNGNMTSLSEQAKLDNETVNQVKKKQKPLSKAKCGTNNPANWGEHNKNFNKYCL